MDSNLAEAVATTVERLRVADIAFVNRRLECEQLTKEIAGLAESKKVASLSQEYYKRAIDLIYQRSIGEVENLLNNALAFVFFDKPYRVNLVMDFSRGKKSVAIVLKDFSNPEDPIEIDVQDGVGAGVRTVISFVLHTYYILSKNAYPCLLLDESYSYLSAQYVGKFFELVKKMCVEKGFTVVLVSHDIRFFDYADMRYEVVDGKVSEV